MAKKYLDNNGLLYLWGKIKATFVADLGYNSSTHQITKTKNGSVSNIVSVPYKTSDLTNDSGYITSADVPEGSSASTVTPIMDGTASKGSDNGFARGDHIHPSDTSRVPISRKVNGKALSADITLGASDVSAVPTSAVGQASGVCPLNANSKVDASYLPSYVDDVIEAYARSGQPALSQNWLATGSATGTVITPEAGKIYVLMADSGDYSANTQFRWSGSTYVKMADGGVSAITNAEIDTIVAS